MNPTNTKSVLVVVLSLLMLAACGGQVDEPMVIGTAEQTMYLPWWMGTEVGTENGVTWPGCSPPFAGGTCTVPSSRKVDIDVRTLTCSNVDPLFAQAIQDAATKVMAYMTARGWDVMKGTNGGLNRSGAVDIAIGCSTTTTQNIGGSQINWNYNNCVNAGSAGVVCKYGSAYGFVYTNRIIDMKLSRGWSNSQMKSYTNNTARHELFHQLGLGHNAENGSLMYPTSDVTSLQLPLSWEGDALECFNPGSGNSPLC